MIASNSRCSCCGTSPIRDLDGQIQEGNLCWLCKCNMTDDGNGKCELHRKKFKPKYKLTDDNKKEMRKLRRSTHEEFLVRIGVKL